MSAVVVNTHPVQLQVARLNAARLAVRDACVDGSSWKRVEALEHLRDLAGANVERTVRALNPGASQADIAAAVRAL